MRTAFLTRNPLLPESSTSSPKGVDKFVEKMNKQLDHSALDIEGPLHRSRSPRSAVAGTLVGASQARSSKSRREAGRRDRWSKRRRTRTTALRGDARRKGWDAYEFHDRTESYVCVGSFEQGNQHGAGAPLPEVAEIVRTFGAKYDTSSAPLAKQRVAANSARAEQVKQTFNQLFSERGRAGHGGHEPEVRERRAVAGRPSRRGRSRSTSTPK